MNNSFSSVNPPVSQSSNAHVGGNNFGFGPASNGTAESQSLYMKQQQIQQQIQALKAQMHQNQQVVAPPQSQLQLMQAPSNQM
jgi:hypothetical protein